MDGPLHREHWQIVIDRGSGLDTTIYDGYEIDRVFIRLGQMVLSLGIEQIAVYRNGEEYRHYVLQQEQFKKIVEAVVQTNGVAFCYDRYCRDDEWTYCIFCEAGDFDPHKKAGWKHKPDCLLVRARALLDSRD